MRTRHTHIQPEPAHDELNKIIQKERKFIKYENYTLYGKLFIYLAQRCLYMKLKFMKKNENIIYIYIYI